MKTKEEILIHLLENGYNNDAINKIMGFMVARELKTLDEKIACKKGDKPFEIFYHWYYDCDVAPKSSDCDCGCECNGCECDCEWSYEEVLASLIDDVTYNLFDATVEGDYELMERYARQLVLLHDIVEDEYPAEIGNEN